MRPSFVCSLTGVIRAGRGVGLLLYALAFSLARQNSLHSIVFDFDLRRSGLSRIMGQRLPHSVSEVLRGEIPFAEQARRYRKNVAFGFHNGTKVANPSEVLQSPETTRILDEITDAYDPDIMLFDMPPIMARNMAKPVKNANRRAGNQRAAMLIEPRNPTAEPIPIMIRPV